MNHETGHMVGYPSLCPPDIRPGQWWIWGGRKGRAPPPGESKFFQFHAVFGKIWQNRMLAPPRGVGAPSSGKSRIRHCWGSTTSPPHRAWGPTHPFPCLIEDMYTFMSHMRHYNYDYFSREVGIMATCDGIHTVTATANKKIPKIYW